jgi:hypothetical protein
MTHQTFTAIKDRPLKNAVVITHAPPGDYRQDFAALPKAYGTPAYENRPDIKAIRMGERR